MQKTSSRKKRMVWEGNGVYLFMIVYQYTTKVGEGWHRHPLLVPLPVIEYNRVHEYTN
jgi:hypothetical protein